MDDSLLLVDVAQTKNNLSEYIPNSIFGETFSFFLQRIEVLP